MNKQRSEGRETYLFKLVGEYIMYSQVVEHDLKLTYAAMVGYQSMEETLIEVDDEAIGLVLNKLRTLDENEEIGYFSEDEYEYLGAIKQMRNHVTHELFEDYLYERTERAKTRKREEAIARVEGYLSEIRGFAPKLEAVRIDIVDDRMRGI